MAEDRETPAIDSVCPKCGSHDVRRAKSEGAWVTIQRLFGRWPYRCRSCRIRFFRAGDPPDEMD